jgi:hypothetical protein
MKEQEGDNTMKNTNESKVWKLDDEMVFEKKRPGFVDVRIGDFQRLASKEDIEKLRDTLNDILKEVFE